LNPGVHGAANRFPLPGKTIKDGAGRHWPGASKELAGN
jgi:hypothetical protein